MTRVTLVHDYLTQRGGAERVVLSLLRAFPGSPLHTSLYEPDMTFPEFRQADVHTLPLNAFGPLRRNHRLALPLLAPAFARHRVCADVVVCSSSGWAHGVRASGRKIVYCHSPPKWLYRTKDYLGSRRPGARLGLAVLRPALLSWDRRAAESADLYVTVSSFIARQIQNVYGIEAEVVPPPPGLDPDGEQEAVPGISPGFYLTVARLLPYKNVQVIVDAFSSLRGEQLVVVGDGPLAASLERAIPSNVVWIKQVSDRELRWLYATSKGVVAASREDLGLSPLEGALFGKPAAVLRWGGFLDTVVEGETGVFFDEPIPALISDAVRQIQTVPWRSELIRAHAQSFSSASFEEKLRCVVKRAVVHHAP